MPYYRHRLAKTTQHTHTHTESTRRQQQHSHNIWPAQQQLLRQQAKDDANQKHTRQRQQQRQRQRQRKQCAQLNTGPNSSSYYNNKRTRTLRTRLWRHRQLWRTPLLVVHCDTTIKSLTTLAWLSTKAYHSLTLFLNYRSNYYYYINMIIAIKYNINLKLLLLISLL